LAKPPDSLLSKALIGARICTGIFFVLFGEYKIFGSAFARTGFAHYLEGYIQQNGGQLLSARSQPRRTPPCCLLWISGRCCGALHRDQSDFRNLCPRGFGSGHASHGEPYSGDVVESRPRGAALAILRRGTRSPAAASSLPDLLYGGSDREVADGSTRTRLVPTYGRGDFARDSYELWGQPCRSSLRSSPAAVSGDNKQRCRKPDTSDCRATCTCPAAPSAAGGR